MASPLDNLFDEQPTGLNAASPLDDLYGESDSPSEPSGLTRRLVGDTAVSALKGAIGVPEAVVGLADIATGGQAGKLAEEAGFRPKEAKAMLDELYSPEQRAANNSVAAEDGFVDKLGAIADSPSVIPHAIIESAPAILAGGVVGKGVKAIGAVKSAMAAGAIGEGAMMAGSAAENIRQQTEDGLMTGKQQLAALATGVVGGVIGAGGAKVGQKLGLGDVDTALVSGALGTSARSMPARVAGGAVQEGALEEMPQSMAETALQNYAMDRDLSEGLGGAAAMGLATGGAMGAGFGALSGQRPQVQPAPTPENPNPAPVDRPDPAAGPLSAAASLLPTVTPNPVADAAKERIMGAGAENAASNYQPIEQVEAVAQELYRTEQDEFNPGKLKYFRYDADLQNHVQVPEQEALAAASAHIAAQTEQSAAPLAPLSAAAATVTASTDPTAADDMTPYQRNQLRAAGATDEQLGSMSSELGDLILSEAADKKTYTNPLQAKNAIQKAGAASTHEAVQVGPKLFEVRPKSEAISIPFRRKQYNEATGKTEDVEGASDIIDYAGRKIVMRLVNGVKVPFYLSTGNGGKADVEAGKWYPFFGIGKGDGWLNKLGGKEINDFYGIPELRTVAEQLNASIGDVRGDKHEGVGATGQHMDFLSQDLNEPTDNGSHDTRTRIDESIRALSERIAAGRTSAAEINPAATTASVQASPEAVERTDGTTDVVSDKGMSIVHGSGNPALTVGDIQIVRTGQKQGKKGRSYGGLYGTSEADSAQAEGYAGMMGGTPTLYDVTVKPGTKILNKTGDITRLSEAYIDELVAQGYGVVQGVDPRGRKETVVIDKAAIASMKARQSTAKPAATADQATVSPETVTDNPIAVTQTPVSAKPAKRKGARKTVDREKDTVVEAVIRLGGLTNSWKQDTTGDTKGNKGIPGVGYLWNDKNGTGLDEMASKLNEQGFVPAGEMDNLGGVPWLQSVLRDHMSGRKEHFAPGSKRQEAESLKQEADRQEARAAQEEAGGDFDSAEPIVSDLLDDADLLEIRASAAAKHAAELDEIFGDSPNETVAGTQSADRPTEEAQRPGTVESGSAGAGQRPQGGQSDARAESPAEEAPSLELTQQTEASAAADAAAQAERDKAEAAKQKKLDDAKKKADNLTAIKAANTKASETFELGQNADDNLSGQSGMFDSAPSLSELGGKPATDDKHKERAVAVELAIYSATNADPFRKDDAPLSDEDVRFILETLLDRARAGKLTTEQFAQSEIGERLDTGLMMALNEFIRQDPVAAIQAMLDRVDARKPANQTPVKDAAPAVPKVMTQREAEQALADAEAAGSGNRISNANERYMKFERERKEAAARYGMTFGDKYDPEPAYLPKEFSLSKAAEYAEIAWPDALSMLGKAGAKRELKAASEDGRLEYAGKKKINVNYNSEAAPSGTGTKEIPYKTFTRQSVDALFAQLLDSKSAANEATAAKKDPEVTKPAEEQVPKKPMALREAEQALADAEVADGEAGLERELMKRRDNPADREVIKEAFASIADFYVDAKGVLGVLAKNAVRDRDGANIKDALMERTGGDLAGIQLASKDGRQWAFFLPDASEPGRVRVSYFDAKGFFGHSTRDTYAQVLDEAFRDGYRAEVTGKLEELAATESFAKGNELVSKVQAVNAGQMSWKDFIDGQKAEQDAFNTDKGSPSDKSRRDSEADSGRKAIATMLDRRFAEMSPETEPFTSDEGVEYVKKSWMITGNLYGSELQSLRDVIGNGDSLTIDNTELLNTGLKLTGKYAGTSKEYRAWKTVYEPVETSNRLAGAGKIENFGEELKGGRSRAPKSLDAELTDEDIAAQPLSKLWPPAEIDGMEDTFAAAVAMAARSEIPAKPRKGYKLNSWVSKVKTLRGLAKFAAQSREGFIAKLKEFDGLAGFAAKVELLELIDRANWKRIGKVSEHPTAYRMDDGKKVSAPFVAIEIDDKRNQFGDAKTVADALDAVNKLLGNEAAGKVMAFEIRKDRTTHQYSINKTGDKEYRVLKEFATLTEARDFMRNNNADLVAAWDGVKDRDNVKKTDVRNAENRPRTGADHRKGKDVTPEMFVDTLGFRGVEFGNWVGQGANAKERQGMLNAAFDALVDLAGIIGVQPKAISLNGTLGLAFGSRGKGNAAAHFEPGNLVINLTKTKGAGTLAHEWFHALDNYFARERGGEAPIKAGINPQLAYRQQNFITYRPEPLYVHKTKHRGEPISKAKLEHYGKSAGPDGYYHPSNWHLDPAHPKGVRPVVEAAFADLVKALEESPMAKRASANDKGPDGYWGRIIERGARAFENFTISKMQEQGYSNDYLANVVEPSNFPRSADRYPYLLPEEMAPITEAFDRLFGTLESKEDGAGNVALFSRVSGATRDGVFLDRGAVQKAAIEAVGDVATGFVYSSYLALPAEIKKSAKAMDIPPHEIRAVHWNGTTYLVDGRFKSALDVERAVYHEHYAHFGMRAKYGAALGPQLRTLLEGVGGLDGLRQLAEQQNIDLSAYEKAIAKDDKTPEHLKPLILMDELLAHVAESGGTLKRLIQEYVGMLRAWLRQMGYKNMAGMGVTDLAAELRGARKAAQQASKNAGSADVRFMFAGAEAATADQYSLDEAAARLEKGESATRVRLETGWSKGADNKWRFEIADDEAGFTDAPIFESFEDFFNRKERENYGARVSPSQMKAAEFTRWKAYRNAVELEYNARNGRRNLGELLDHPKLFAAYPDLAGVQVSFPRESDSRGSYYPRYDNIEVALSADPEQMLSTLLHEVQHAIQHREGFAMGGNSDRNFADAVKGAVQRMKQTTREQAAMWRITNQSAIKAAEQAAETARYGLLFESATRLMEHSRRDRPSGVFRNIRNEMQWLYDPMFKGNEKARDLQYAFYEIPKPHNMDKRNAFISKMAFDAGQLFMEQIPAETRAQFKADTRTMKGMLNALEREARNKRKELRPLDDLNASERAAQAVYDSTEYATSYDIYRALAGEAEARNTQTRQNMTDAERRATSPASTLDVDASKLIVMFGGMDVHAPAVMASQVQPETIYIGSMFGDGTTRVLKNPTRNQALAFAKAAKHESMRGIVDPATGDLYLADSYAVDHKMLAEGVGLTWEDVRYSTDPETGSSNRLNIPANSVEFYPRPIFSGDQKNQSARYRLTDTNTKGIPLFSAKAIAKKLNDKLGISVKVAATEADLPADLQAQIKRDGATGKVGGVFHNGQSYIIASNLSDAQHAVRLVLHEAIGHGGVQAVLGDKLGKVMQGIYNDMPAAMRRELEARYAGKLAGLSKAAREQEVAEEYVAHLAENDPQHGVISKLVALIKQFIRDTFGEQAAGKWTRNDIVQLLAEAKKAARNNNGPQGGSRYRQGAEQHAEPELAEVSDIDEAEFVASLKGPAVQSIAGAMYKARGTDSPFFKNWFGKSKMVKDGKPIGFYHRGHGTMDSFDDARLGSSTGTATASLGHFLARTDVGNVERYGPDVDRFFVKMEKPLVVTQDQFSAMGDWSVEKVKAYRKTLMARGHDGMYVQGLGWPIVFEGKNIKGVRNAGTFDETDRTRYSLAQTATAAFNRWFGDSKVRELMQNSKQRFEDMPPIVVYHSTNADFDSFASGRETVNSTTFGDMATERHGVFFAENPKFAEGYGAGSGQRVMPVYLSIKNPIYLDEGISGNDLTAIVDNADGKIVARDFYGLPAHEMWQVFDGDFGKNFVDAAKAAGFDGAYMIESDQTSDEPQSVWVAFDPEQIKSAVGNNGDFDGSNPNIRYSLTGARDLFDRATGPAPLDRNDPFAAENRRLREQDKTLWQKAKKEFSRQFAPGGLLPESVFAEKITRDSEFQAVEFDVRHLSGGLNKAVNADYGVDIDNLTAEQMKPLAEALSGKVDPAIPEGTRVAIVAMRQYIDSLSGEYLSILQKQVEANMQGADQALIDKITGNLGAYVNRSYQAFDDPKWFKTVPTEVVNTARAYLASGYMEQGETAAEARRLADVTVNEMLKNGTAYDSMGAFIAEGKLGAKDLTVLIKRKEIAPEIRALLGEYMDPRLNFAKSATKMGRLVWNQRFLDRVLDFGMGTLFFEGKNRPADATTQIAGDQSETYAPLNGLWTFPEVAQAFQDALGKEQMSDLYRTVVRLNGMVKYGKTILSPTTAMRNWQSAMFFSLANGHFDLTQMKHSWAAMREQVTQNATGDDLTYLRKLKQLGVVYDTPYAGEMMALLQDARMDELLSSKSGTGLKWLRKANQFAQGFYSFGDDFWKIIGYENEKASLIAAGIPEAEAETMAAKRIRDTYPTYSMIGKAVQWLRRFPLVGTFVSFPSEIIRTTVNMMKLTAADLKSDNPKIQALGRKRAAGMAMVSAGFYALSAMTAAALGVGDDEEEALRDLSAPWSKNSTFLYTGRDADGKLRYFDMSFLDPYGYWKRPLTAMLRDQPWEDAAVSGLSDMLSPFFGADITAGAIFEVMANKKPTGGQVYNEHAGSVDQLQDISNHMRKALQPGFVSNGERLWLAGSDARREGSGQPYDMRDEVVSLLGWRAATLDTQTGLYYRSFDFTDALTDAKKTLTRTLRSSNDVSKGDIQESKQAANAQYQKAFTEMGRLVSSAEAAGMSRREVMQTLKLSGVAQRNIVALLNGRVPEMDIGMQAQAKAVKQAGVMRGSEHAAEIARRFRLAREQ